MTAKHQATVLCFSTLLFCQVAISGCGGGDKSKDNGKSSGEQPDGPIVREAKLELLGDYGPPLDGIVEIAPPKGWIAPSREAQYLVQYTGSLSNDNPLPRIRITAVTSTFPEPNVTEENLADFLAHVEAGLKKSGQSASIIEVPRGMIIGGRPCVRYVKKVALRNRRTTLSSDSQMLITVANGKRFQVELQVLEGQIKASLDQSYAVFAGMKFIGAAVTPAPEPPAEEPEKVDGSKQD